MSNSLPQIIPLNGSDFFQALLDQHHRKTGYLGNVSRLLLQLEGRVEATALQEVIDNDPVFQWLARLRLKNRFLFQLPIWSQQKKGGSMLVEVHQSTGDWLNLPDSVQQRDLNPKKGSPFLLDISGAYDRYRHMISMAMSYMICVEIFRDSYKCASLIKNQSVLV